MYTINHVLHYSPAGLEGLQVVFFIPALAGLPTTLPFRRAASSDSISYGSIILRISGTAGGRAALLKKKKLP